VKSVTLNNPSSFCYIFKFVESIDFEMLIFKALFLRSLPLSRWGEVGYCWLFCGVVRSLCGCTFNCFS